MFPVASLPAASSAIPLFSASGNNNGTRRSSTTSRHTVIWIDSGENPHHQILNHRSESYLRKHFKSLTNSITKSIDSISKSIHAFNTAVTNYADNHVLADAALHTVSVVNTSVVSAILGHYVLCFAGFKGYASLEGIYPNLLGSAVVGGADYWFDREVSTRPSLSYYSSLSFTPDFTILHNALSAALGNRILQRLGVNTLATSKVVIEAVTGAAILCGGGIVFELSRTAKEWMNRSAPSASSANSSVQARHRWI